MLVINNIKISQNEDGLYSLADLWRGTGEQSHKKPSQWLRRSNIKHEVEYLSGVHIYTQVNQQVISKNEHGYTYVCEDLVYSYAMWVSAEYKFTVIRAFKALVQGDIDTAVKIAVRSVMINKAGSEFDRLANDDSAIGEKAMNDLCSASDLYKTNASIAGSDLASCRGKKAKRNAAEQAIINRSQMNINL